MTTAETRAADHAKTAGWLARLRHDLLKHALFLARDILASRQSGEPVTVAQKRSDRADLADLVDLADLAALHRSLVELRDHEGATTTATALWRTFRSELFAHSDHAVIGALDAFEGAVVEAEARTQGDDIDAAVSSVIALDAALQQLARRLAAEDVGGETRAPRT